ncbi:MAG: VOC family protein [Ignavibacteriae bacterium]|nr:VOC family protein [Ignavibacteriota bacterium]
MNTKVFINLAVKDLKKTMDFFGKLGFEFNSQFTDENAACMIINEDAYAMLLTEPFFKSFIKKELTDAHNSTEVLVALSMESREKVNDFMQTALSNGATEDRETQDLGFMYGRAFNDPDGHIWEIFWMDENHVNQETK